MLLAALLAIALALAQARLRAPAMPVTLAVILTVLGLVCTVALIIRVLLDQPGAGLDTAAGGYLGLVAAVAVFAGAVHVAAPGGDPRRRRPGRDPHAVDLKPGDLESPGCSTAPRSSTSRAWPGSS